MSPVKIAALVLVCVLTFSQGASAQHGDPFGSKNSPTQTNPFAPPPKDSTADPQQRLLDDLVEEVHAEKAAQAKKQAEQAKSIKEREAAIEKRIAAETKQREQLLEQLRGQLPEKLHVELTKSLEAAAKQRADLEYDLLQEQIQQLELRKVFERLETELKLDREKLVAEMEQVQQQAAVIRAHAAADQRSLIEIQKWLAHALQSIDQPGLQNWVLSHLKAAPEVTRRLTERPNTSDELEYLSQNRQLELALKEMSRSDESTFSQSALELVRLIDPAASPHANRAAISTSRWPIVAEKNRNREQELLDKLDERSSFVFIEVPLDELIEYLRDVFDVSIVFDQAANEKLTELGDVFIDLEDDELSLRAGLEKVLALHQLTYQVRDEAIVITTQKQAQTNPLRRLYNVAQLDDTAESEKLVQTLQEAIGADDLKILRMGQRLLVVGSEQQHFELSKLLTLLHLSQ